MPQISSISISHWAARTLIVTMSAAKAEAAMREGAKIPARYMLTDLVSIEIDLDDGTL